jgi:dephospho-CoA kinase
LKVLGLTGSIAMGKSTVSTMLKRRHIPLHDSDTTVHRLMSSGGDAFRAISRVFPTVIVDGNIDRQRLGAIVFGDVTQLKLLESLTHPLVARETRRFLARECRRGSPLVVLDIPLLFETGGEARCDFVVTVSAPDFIQQQRVLRRPGMTFEKFQSIKKKQMPNEEKCRKSDFVLLSGAGLAATEQAVDNMLSRIRLMDRSRPAAWPPNPFINKPSRGIIHA